MNTIKRFFRWLLRRELPPTYGVQVTVDRGNFCADEDGPITVVISRGKRTVTIHDVSKINIEAGTPSGSLVIIEGASIGTTPDLIFETPPEAP